MQRVSLQYSACNEYWGLNYKHRCRNGTVKVDRKITSFPHMYGTTFVFISFETKSLKAIKSETILLGF